MGWKSQRSRRTIKLEVGLRHSKTLPKCRQYWLFGCVDCHDVGVKSSFMSWSRRGAVEHSALILSYQIDASQFLGRIAIHPSFQLELCVYLSSILTCSVSTQYLAPTHAQFHPQVSRMIGERALHGSVVTVSPLASFFKITFYVDEKIKL
jgi:hypothetical protein